MLKYFLNGLFVLFSIIVPVLIISWYVQLTEKRGKFPFGRTFGDWMVEAVVHPFKTVIELYGDETSAAKKDFIGLIIFAIVICVSSNFFYFRGEFFTEQTLQFFLVMIFIFFLVRLIFVVSFIFRDRSNIQAFNHLHHEQKIVRVEKENLKKKLPHINKRGKAVNLIYRKWKRHYEKMIAEKEELEERIEEERVYLNGKLQTLSQNLEKIAKLDPDTVIAVDSNVLMKSDDYLIEAISRFPIMISKKVQQEWDKNKASDNREKGYRARLAIRRLVELPNYQFTVSKWRDQFLKEHNLLKGVPDDEIIADYLYEQKSGKNIIVLSDDLNFIASAKVHMPILKLENMDIFS